MTFFGNILIFISHEPSERFRFSLKTQLKCDNPAKPVVCSWRDNRDIRRGTHNALVQRITMGMCNYAYRVAIGHGHSFYMSFTIIVMETMADNVSSSSIKTYEIEPFSLAMIGEQTYKLIFFNTAFIVNSYRFH